MISHNISKCDNGTHTRRCAFTHTCNMHEHMLPPTHTVKWKEHEKIQPKATSQHYPSIHSVDTLLR
jgi:hypothetical protein